MSDERPIYTRVSKAESTFGVSPATLYRWRKKGLILIYHRHGSSFVKTREVMDFIEKGDVAA